MTRKREVTPVQTEAAQISKDMRDVFNRFKDGGLKREDADTLANISGKNIKALSLIVADQMREDAHRALLHKLNAIDG
jgi:hypothetical protein